MCFSTKFSKLCTCSFSISAFFLTASARICVHILVLYSFEPQSVLLPLNKSLPRYFELALSLYSAAFFPLAPPFVSSLSSSLSHFPRPGLGRNMGGAILVLSALSTSIDAPAAGRGVTLKASSESAHVPPSGFSALISRVWSRSRVPAISRRDTWVVMVFSRYRRMGRAPYCVG